MLTLEGVSAGYGGLQILHGVSLHVDSGEVVALIGANGAGKTTTLRTIAGITPARQGRITFQGASVLGARPHELVARGMVMVAEDRELFGGLTVRENLLLGGYTRTAEERSASLAEVYELFPILDERHQQLADTLSGGQQQMLAIGRALMARPQLLMLDEPSMGLAPQLVTTVFDVVSRIREQGITVLIVEQNAQRTLQTADRAYVIENGEISLEGTGRDLVADPRVRKAYLGL